MNTDLIPAISSIALLGALVRPLLVIWLLSGLWFGLARAAMPLRRRVIAWGAVAIGLIVWLGAVWTLALRGTFGLASSGFMVGSDLVLVATVLTLLVRSKSIAAALDAAPAWWLVGSQGYRIVGVVFVRLWAAGVLPGSFALPAGIGDTVTGLAAIATAVALWRNASWARTVAYGVNLFGIADLLNVITMGALGAASHLGPSPFAAYPLALVPTFGVPIGFIVHCLSLWQLHRQGRSLRQPQGVAAQTP